MPQSTHPLIRTAMQSPHLIWQHTGWPALQYDAGQVGAALSFARRAQGIVEGKLTALGFEQRQTLAADAWSSEAVATSAIEGERLDLLAVRSSVARRLGVSQHKGPNAPRHVDGLLDIMQDAVDRARAPLTHERLQAWQAALFPTGFSGMARIAVGTYRQNDEPMQIVSGRVGHERIHYEAPASSAVPREMDRFLHWLDSSTEPEPLVRAALAHLWFETIHPFEDGNGRVGRVIIDLLLARDAGEASRLIRISQQLLDQRDAYYDELERAQHGPLDVTAWVLWFVSQVHAACETASTVIETCLVKARFWNDHRDKPLTPRQRKAVNVLLDAGPGGFEGGLSARKYETIGATSGATATRELVELVALGLLRPSGAGRSRRYHVNLEGWQPPG
jgi:Fic family protein